MTFSMLEQLLEEEIEKSKGYIIPCLMIIAPDCFLIEKPVKDKGFDKKIETLFTKSYAKIFASMSTNTRYENSFEQNILLLPFFGFGESAINGLWEELDRRVDILEKNKEKAVIK